MKKSPNILLVVNMFLTGFDSPTLNTLYVDKNLKYHGLIQAYSRTNRILNEQKSQGNIVVFRNLKKATDEAITLFSNKDAIDVILVEPYEDYVSKFEAIADNKPVPEKKEILKRKTKKQEEEERRLRPSELKKDKDYDIKIEYTEEELAEIALKDAVENKQWEEDVDFDEFEDYYENEE